MVVFGAPNKLKGHENKAIECAIKMREKLKELNYLVVSTMMRIDLDEPMSTGDSYTFNIKWSYEINDRMKIGGRGGYEYFPKDKNFRRYGC